VVKRSVDRVSQRSAYINPGNFNSLSYFITAKADKNVTSCIDINIDTE
jgi:hypothetical protein